MSLTILILKRYRESSSMIFEKRVIDDPEEVHDVGKANFVLTFALERCNGFLRHFIPVVNTDIQRYQIWKDMPSLFRATS